MYLFLLVTVVLYFTICLSYGCKNTEHGCCLDGITEAKGEDFKGCRTVAMNIASICTLDKDRGSCKNYTAKWFFDTEYGGCSTFWYSGCNGNANRFESKEECDNVCVEPQGKDRCFLPKVTGPCEKYSPQWYYDNDQKACTQFTYGGCLGNNNRFQTIEECKNRCVKDSSNDKQPIETNIAPQGSTVVMDCRTSDLEQPLTYQWSKPNGVLPRNVDIHSRTIRINDVGDTDAGTYMCTVSNGRTSINRSIIFIVTDVVPYFAQSPTSFIALDTLSDAYIQFSFEISFKPHAKDGLILYNGFRKSSPYKDFVSLALVDGIAEFRFNLGQQVTIVRNDSPLVIGQWHIVNVTRNRKTGIMYVDEQGPFTGIAEGEFVGLDLTELLYIGGVPNFTEIAPEVQVETGFVGCISHFKIGDYHHNILREAVIKEGVTTCDTCSENPCLNQGVCQEALTIEGYNCIGPAGFSGPKCYGCKNKENGNCSDEETSAQSLNQEGRRCEFTKYGCCLDGVTEAKGEGCKVPFNVPTICSLEKDRGSCKNYTTKWFFDTDYGGCSRFWYGGCDGNANRFNSKQECHNVCVEPQGKDVCFLPKVSGPCEGHYFQWYYDTEQETCTQFTYSGCLGNNNRFKSKKECIDLCVAGQKRK